MTKLAGPPRPSRVALFVTCLGDVFYPEAGEATVRLLHRLGIAVDFPLGQTCCGQPAFNAGFRQPAKDVARRNLALFADAEYIIVPSGSCAFLVNVVGVERLGAVFHGKIAYHASCHLLRELGVAEEPRRLIMQVEGAELVPMDLAEQCCGFGGTFAVKYPEISDAMLQKKIASLKRAGADTLVSCDAGCLMHMAGRLRRQGETIRIMHLAELLNAGGAVDAPPRPFEP